MKSNDNDDDGYIDGDNEYDIVKQRWYFHGWHYLYISATNIMIKKMTMTIIKLILTITMMLSNIAMVNSTFKSWWQI